MRLQGAGLALAALVTWGAFPAHAGEVGLRLDPVTLTPRASLAERAWGWLGLDGRGLELVAGEDGDGHQPTVQELLREEDALSEPNGVPSFRLELSYRFAWLVDARVKKGRGGSASTLSIGRDNRVPILVSPGLRVLFDVKFHERGVLGLHYTGMLFDGPRRRLHGATKTLNSTAFDATQPTETVIDIQLTEVFVRYVVRDRSRIRFAFGVGAAWVRLQLRMRSAIERARGRIQTVFVPTIGYHVSAALHPRLVVFLESLTAVIAPWKIPSYLSEFRAGLRIPLGGGVELMAAASMNSAWLEHYRDIWGPRPTDGHKLKAANWTAVTADFGLAWRF